MNQRGAQSVSGSQQPRAASNNSTQTTLSYLATMQIFLLLTAASVIGLVSASQHQDGFAGPQINGGIGDGYIYPIKSAGGQHHKHAPPAAHYRAQLAHQAAAPTSVRTYKLFFEQAPHNANANAIGGGQQQSRVKILKIVEAPGQHSSHGSSGYGKAESIETIKLIHIKGPSNCQHAAPQAPPPAPSYQIDLPVSPAIQWQ